MLRSLCLTVISTVVTLLSASLLHAATPQNLGPKTIEFKMGSKTIVFKHHKHQQLAKNQCWECHDKKNGKIENWGEATAHKLCIPCHDLSEKGPVVCKGCHKK
jgi:predicted CXXCH cytochrome family protein